MAGFHFAVDTMYTARPHLCQPASKPLTCLVRAVVEKYEVSSGQRQRRRPRLNKDGVEECIRTRRDEGRVYRRKLDKIITRRQRNARVAPV